jgi:hypothetical protein
VEGIACGEIRGRLTKIEADMGVLAERLESTKGMVIRNQSEFKDRITGLEDSHTETAVSLATIRSEFRTGTGLLAFLIVSGISLVAIFVGK